MKTHFIFLVFFAALMLPSCNKSSPTSGEEKGSEKNEELNTVLTGYFKIKDALVKDNSAKAKEEAASLASLTGQYQEELNEYIGGISENSDDIEMQREAFEALSISLYDLVKTENAGQTIYKQYCPMAFNDKGAFWLSDTKEIYNPYFGSSMLRCGSVEEVIGQ